MTSAIAACRSMGTFYFLPEYLSTLAKAHADLRQLDSLTPRQRPSRFRRSRRGSAGRSSPREVVDALPLLGRQSIAVIRDNRRIGTIELDLHRVVDDTADHRNGLKNGREHIEANEGRERVDEKAHEPHRLVLRSSSNPGILSSPSTRRPDRTVLGRRAEAGGRPSAAESLRRPCAWSIRR
jgi:hypothetical protein